MKIKHKFHRHNINNQTHILIIGTFNPKTKCNLSNFFYGRERNYFWKLLPTTINENNLRCSSKKKKLKFINKYKIDFIDLIKELKINKNQQNNYSDIFIDNKVSEWENVINKISKLEKTKYVFFTRKSFTNIPNIKRKFNEIKEYCNQNKIKVNLLPTPSRYYNMNKQIEWNNKFKCTKHNNQYNQ